MDETINLDKEYNKYLYILKPYLGQLADESVVLVCNAWLQKLSDCPEDEKPLRNKYAFSMCYQLARGVLFEPFLELPPENNLPPFSDVDSSEDFTIEDGEKGLAHEESRVSFEIAFHDDFDDPGKCKSDSTAKKAVGEDDNGKDAKESVLNNGNDKPFLRNRISKNVNAEALKLPEKSEWNGKNQIDFERAAKLIMQLRRLKKENVGLQEELSFMKNHFQMQINNRSSSSFDDDGQNRKKCFKVGNHSLSSCESVRSKLGDTKVSRNELLYNIEKLQDELEFFEERKRYEIEKMIEKYEHKMLELKTLAEEQEKKFQKKMDDTTKLYENKLRDTEDSAGKKVQELQVKSEFLVKEKDIIVESKDKEIENLEKQLKEAKESFQTLTNKFAEKASEGTSDCDFFKARAIELEKKVNKLEKYNNKCAKSYNAKLAMLQRDKHLTECSLQLQLVRQRSKIINKSTDENQTELKTALDNLEFKYKEIVANIQSTAIQRKIQDQFYLESILQTYGMSSDGGTKANFCGSNRGQAVKTNINRSSLEAELSVLLGESKGQEEMGGLCSGRVDDSTEGYCLDARKMGELFERIYVPQKDVGDGPHQK